MKVLHVAQPAEAGVPRAVASLIEFETEHHEFVVAGDPLGYLARVCADRGVAFEPWSAARSPVAGLCQEFTALGAIIRRVEPDVVVLHSAKAGLVGRLLLRGRIPTVYAPHAWSFLAANGLLETLAIWWERAAQRWTDVTVCMCQDEVDRGRRTSVDAKYRVIRNGLDFRAYAASGDATSVPSQSVVCVGRLCPQKGQDVLLEAWMGVLQEIPRAELVIVGDGPDRLRLEEQAHSSVHFVGPVDDARPFYSDARVVVVPSRWETMSLVALEGMASRRPVVASDFDGARECLGATGRIVPIGDASGLSRAIVELLKQDEVTWRHEADAARAEAESRGDILLTRGRWNGVYVEAGSRRASRA